MKKSLLIFSAALLMALLPSCSREPSHPRAFGLHFDFHAGPADSLIGSILSEAEIQEIIDLYHPDFLQVDCKGHPGWTSYPSKCGNSVPGIVGNPLATWRKVTKENGVGLYVHYSGVWDYRWCAAHPDDAAMWPDGTRSKNAARTNGYYVDSLLIPQMLEIASLGVDGAWIDGDCWGVEKDCDPRTLEAFTRETGIDLEGKAPVTPEDKYYREFADYCRELYCRYQKHYVDSIHSQYPDFKVISNWAYTEHMPLKPVCDVDFVSGDLPWEDCIYWGRYSARSAMNNNIPWDFMAWAFRNTNPHTYKNPIQLMQEGSSVISLGGGFQMYITQRRDGSPRMDEIRRLAPVADFIRPRLEWTYGGSVRPQVAVLSCLEQRFEAQLQTGWWGQVFSRAGYEKILGLVSLLADAGHSVTTISEAELEDGGASKYPVIVIPELYKDLDGATFALLEKYVMDGGSALLTGSSVKRYFPDAPAEDSVVSYGKGKVGLIPDELSWDYFTNADKSRRERVCAVLDSLYEPEVKLLGADGLLEVIDFEKDGRRMVQLVNCNGQHHDKDILLEDSIPAVKDISLSIALPKKPRAIYRQPEDVKLDFTWQDGRAQVRLPELAIHSTLVVKL